MTTLQNMLQEGVSYPSTLTPGPMGKLRPLAGAEESTHPKSHSTKVPGVGLKSKTLHRT